MNKKILIIIGAVVGIILVLLVFFWLRNSNTQTPMPNSGQGTSTSTFPTSGSGINPTNTFSMKTVNGGSIQTKDFLKDPETVKDSVNQGHYSLGNHFSKNGTSSLTYVIEFIDATDFFTVGLFKEPIALARKQAEQYLMEHLGISQSQMCQLQYMVTVPADVNEFYSGRNLEFSFCPGSVQIPE